MYVPFNSTKDIRCMLLPNQYCLLLSHELDMFWWMKARIRKNTEYGYLEPNKNIRCNIGGVLSAFPRLLLPYAAPSRNYPIRFGWKLLQLRDLMLRDHSQPPSKRWDFTFGDMAAVLANLDWSNSWDEANIGSVCHYLRGSKDLVLPPEIRAIIPTSI